MIIYNVTTKVDATIADAWLSWAIDEHITDVMQTGCFSSYKLVRLMEVDDSEGPTYAIQYRADSKADYNRYISIYVAGLRDKALSKWGERFISFRSVMQVVSES